MNAGRKDRPFDEQGALVAMSGSSVATALLSGVAALVRQYFLDGWYPTGEKLPEVIFPAPFHCPHDFGSSMP